MKIFKYTLFTFALFLSFSCSKNDESLTEDGINKAPNQRPTGASSHDLLSSGNYKSLVIEITCVDNLTPNPQTVSNIQQFLNTRINKPNGITVVTKQIPAQTGTPFSNTEITQIEDSNRTQYNNNDVLKLNLLFLNGASESDTNTSKILGVAYRNTSCVIFQEAIIGFSNQLGEPNRVDLETTVILHEIGHLLGLVNLGSAMQTNHLDTAHDKHCTNQNCLMYWQIENSGVMQMMTGGNVPQLDANCLADLLANGGK